MKLIAIVGALLALSGPCFAQYAAPGRGQDATQSQLPDGVQKIYALEGDNSLVAMSTPEGYQRLRVLVKAIDGDLETIQMTVISATLRTSDLAALDITGSLGNGLVDAADTAKLTTALSTGRILNSARGRITTREYTPVETRLRGVGADGGTSLAFVARIMPNDAISMEITAPSQMALSITPGQTAVLALSAPEANLVRLIFLTPRLSNNIPRPVH